MVGRLQQRREHHDRGEYQKREHGKSRGQASAEAFSDPPIPVPSTIHERLPPDPFSPVQFSPTPIAKAMLGCANAQLRPVRSDLAAAPPAAPVAAPHVSAGMRLSVPLYSRSQPVVRALFSKMDTPTVLMTPFLSAPLEAP
jgi:hypothetical protein